MCTKHIRVCGTSHIITLAQIIFSIACVLSTPSLANRTNLHYTFIFNDLDNCILINTLRTNNPFPCIPMLIIIAHYCLVRLGIYIIRNVLIDDYTSVQTSTILIAMRTRVHAFKMSST